jgi:hypothetical protein
MGETFAETRREVGDQRVELNLTAAQLRARVERALDVRAKLRQNPLLFGGLAAGAVFLAVGGPMRLLRAARRRLAPRPPEKAYDALPKTLQTWVDAAAESLGPRAADARQTLAQELQRWRHDPDDRKRARALAKEMAEGQAGPGRAAWKALEAAATIVSAALARRAIERFLSGDRPMTAAAELAPAHPTANGVEGSGKTARVRRLTGRDADTGYTGWSGRRTNP